MKRLLIISVAILSVFFMTPSASADLNEFENEIYSQLNEAETADIDSELKSIGIDSDNPESVSNISTDGILNYVMNIFREAMSRPAKIILITSVFGAMCQLSTTLSYKSGIYAEIFVIVCFIAVSSHIVDAFNSTVNAMLSCQAFMTAYIPAFAAVVAASGNITAAVSYNAIVLYFCEAAAFLATAVLRPILCCMLVMSVTQSINPDICSITSIMKRALTVIIGFIMTLFLGIIGLQTLVGRGVDGLAVKAGKYAVSSFVPVIGYSLSESYKAVSVSLSAIRTSIGTFGIVILLLFMLSPIITVTVYKLAFSVCTCLCRLIGAERISVMMSGLADVFSFAGTVLTMFMLMLTVSTGMLIILGGELA